MGSQMGLVRSPRIAQIFYKSRPYSSHQELQRRRTGNQASPNHSQVPAARSNHEVLDILLLSRQLCPTQIANRIGRGFAFRLRLDTPQTPTRHRSATVVLFSRMAPLPPDSHDHISTVGHRNWQAPSATLQTSEEKIGAPSNGRGSTPMVRFWGRCTTHFRLFWLDWDVHWGYGIWTHGMTPDLPAPSRGSAWRHSAALGHLGAPRPWTRLKQSEITSNINTGTQKNRSHISIFPTFRHTSPLSIYPKHQHRHQRKRKPNQGNTKPNRSTSMCATHLSEGI